MPSACRSRASHARRGTVFLAAAVAALAAPAFVGFAGAGPHRGSLQAEGSSAPSPAPSTAIVQVTEENTTTTAGIIGGLFGLLVGGVWVGGALFAASSYLARQENNDAAKALKGVAAGGLEALNFVGYLSDKYAVSSTVSKSVSEAVTNAKSNANSKELNDVVDGISGAIDNFDKDVGIKDTVGSLVKSGTDLASQAVGKAVTLNDEFKVTDQIKSKIDEVSATVKK